jgi:lipopolysaccharide export system permease protein
VLSLLSFDNYVLDLRALLPARPSFRYKPSDLYLHELIFPASTDRADVADRGRLLAEANARIAAPLYDIAFGALAIVAVIGGPFSRMGYGARIAVSAAVALLVRIAGLGAEALSVRTPEAGLLQYAIPAGAAAACIWLMLRRTAPRSAALLPGGRAALPRAASAG